MRGQKMTPERIARMRELLLLPNWNMERVAAKMKVSRATVYRYTGGKKKLTKGKRRGK